MKFDFWLADNDIERMEASEIVEKMSKSGRIEESFAGKYDYER